MKSELITFFEEEFKRGISTINFSDLINIDINITKLISEYNNNSEVIIKFNNLFDIDLLNQVHDAHKNHIRVLGVLIRINTKISHYQNDNIKTIPESEIKNYFSILPSKFASNYSSKILISRINPIPIGILKENLFNLLSQNIKAMDIINELFNLVNVKDFIGNKLLSIDEDLQIKEFIKLTNDLDNNFYRIQKLENEVIVYDKSQIDIKVIEKLNDFLTILSNISLNKQENLFFRGHADFKWNLIPSIYRDNLIVRESELFQEIIINHPEEFENIHSTFEKLTKMQHYELPTRLLDITHNPLVALFFACNSHSDKPGEVHIFKVNKSEIKYYNSDTVSILSNLSKINSPLNIKELLKMYKENIQKFNDDSEIVKLVHEIREEKSYFVNRIIPSDFFKTIFVKTKFNNERIKRQRGAFIIFGIDKIKLLPSKMKDNYRVQSKKIKIIIPDKISKKNILKELKLLDIHISSLFPEIDKTANFLKNEK